MPPGGLALQGCSRSPKSLVLAARQKWIIRVSLARIIGVVKWIIWVSLAIGVVKWIIWISLVLIIGVLTLARLQETTYVGNFVVFFVRLTSRWNAHGTKR